MASQGHRRSALACLAARTSAAPRRPVRQGGLPLKSRRGPRQKVIGQALAKARFTCGGIGIAVAEAKHATAHETPRHLEFQGLSLRDEGHISFRTGRSCCPHGSKSRLNLRRHSPIIATRQSQASHSAPQGAGGASGPDLKLQALDRDHRKTEKCEKNPTFEHEINGMVFQDELDKGADAVAF
jgi:hypothetical protein